MAETPDSDLALDAFLENRVRALLHQLENPHLEGRDIDLLERKLQIIQSVR